MHYVAIGNYLAKLRFHIITFELNHSIRGDIKCSTMCFSNSTVINILVMMIRNKFHKNPFIDYLIRYLEYRQIHKHTLPLYWLK